MKRGRRIVVVSEGDRFRLRQHVSHLELLEDYLQGTRAWPAGDDLAEFVVALSLGRECVREVVAATDRILEGSDQ